MELTHRAFLSDRALKSELDRCESCVEKPCRAACPAGCSPADFIRAARGMSQSDFDRAGDMLRSQNPLAGVCGAVCREKHCVAACSKNKTGAPILIPAIQKAILERTIPGGAVRRFHAADQSLWRVAVIGAGPAGLAAAAFLAQGGCRVTVFEAKETLGGMCRLIPECRLPPSLLDKDIAFISSLGIQFITGARITDPATLTPEFDGIVLATGRWQSRSLPIPGIELALDALDYLAKPAVFKRVTIIGCGGIAVDCVQQALEQGAQRVDILALETLCELPLEQEELAVLFQPGVVLHLRHSVTAIEQRETALSIHAEMVDLPNGAAFSPQHMIHHPESAHPVGCADAVILAVGTAPPHALSGPKMVYAGEYELGPASVVEAVASGKRAGVSLLNLLDGKETAADGAQMPLPGYRALPVSLETTILGVPVKSPFLLSASPMSDGYSHVKAAYDAGWSGAILKTAFDNIPIKTPAAYMHCSDALSYANCDSVSARSLAQLCADVARLRLEYPDRLTMASTGTEMTGNSAEDQRRWQSVTKKLEQAGAMGIEYSLSCPGTDGTDALALNQDMGKVLQVVRWILEIGDPAIPKLFKLTASVPALGRFVTGIKAVADEFPGAKICITIGDTLPNLIFQPRSGGIWEDAISMGMGGRRILAINAFAIAACTGRGIPISASGGIMSYKDAADMLALGAEFVQLCSLPMRYGVEILHELESGLSALMAHRGIKSIAALHGMAKVLPFDALSEVKQLPAVEPMLCAHCGNCLSCHAQAVHLDDKGCPVFDPDRCIGCTFCTQICFTGALHMTDRTIQ